VPGAGCWGWLLVGRDCGWGWGWVLAARDCSWVAGGQALRCSCYLGLGSAVPAPMFLGTQPPHAT